MGTHHNVAVIGAAGGIGQPLSLLLKNLTLINRLVLFDIVDAVQGLKVDLSHIETSVQVEAFTGDKNNAEIQKAQLHAALQGVDVVIIPAGIPRGPNMSRDQLFNINANIVKEIIEAVAEICPKACICMISNPVNSTVPLAAEVLRNNGVFDDKKLFGVSTLDVVRSNTFLAQSLGVNPKDLSVKVIGGHSGQTILPLLSEYNLGQEVIVELTDRIRNAGTEVVQAKAGKGSATVSMAYAAARFCTSLLKGLSGEEGIYECSYIHTDIVPGVKYFATRVRLGRNGVESVERIDNLSEYERGLLETEVIPQLEESIRKGIDYVANQ